jgi:glycosyltransferase involved in cell wall biosynthesis
MKPGLESANGRGLSQSAEKPGVLAILVKRFPRLSETFILNEIIELRRQGVPLRIFAVMDPQEPHSQPEAEELRDEVHYIRAGQEVSDWLSILPEASSSFLFNPGGSLRAGRFLLQRRSWNTSKHFLEALALCKELERVGAVHLHAAWAHTPAAIAHLVNMISGIPFSFTAHAKDLYTTLPGYIARRGHDASFVITCTQANAAYLSRILGPDAPKVAVCPHGIDLERFGTLRRTPIPGRILSVGRLVPKKGFEFLLRALALVDQQGIDFHCRIFGGGPLRGELRTLAQSLGVAGKVEVKGARRQVDLLNEFSRAETFALSPIVTSDGDRDGVPNVLAEAMGAGLPVVSTSISGIPELIDDENSGLLVPERDPQALAEALTRLLTDETLRKRLSDGGRGHVHETHALADRVRPLTEIFMQQIREPSVAAAIK